jgi:hypothetical protein
MAGEKLDAARRAAIGVVENLADREQLAVTAFDHDVLEVESLARSPRGQRSSRSRGASPDGATTLTGHRGCSSSVRA